MSTASKNPLTKQQTSSRLRTANNTIINCFVQIHAPGKCFISSIMSKFWWYAFQRQHKPPSSPEQRIIISSDLYCNGSTDLLSLATSANVYLMSIFPLWIPFEHSNFSFRRQPHSPIKPDWSDVRDPNFDFIQFSGFISSWCNTRSSLRCLCTIDWHFSLPVR